LRRSQLKVIDISYCRDIRDHDRASRGGLIMNDGWPMARTTFSGVGCGRRCRFFLRIAAAAPDRLRAVGIVSRVAKEA
jgi:hypothetical protein